MICKLELNSLMSCKNETHTASASGLKSIFSPSRNTPCQRPWLGFLKQIVNLLVKLGVGFAGRTKLDVATFAPLGLRLVVQLGVDELKDFLKSIHAGIRQHQVFEVEDDLFQRPLFSDEFIARGKFFNRDALVNDLGQRLI